jgi:NAD(P)-dependent dehydrogenase (short-subunit alcohol dehydrogenase family)
MREFHRRTAVVTGAASGIGRALATRLAGEGMRVVLADVERPALEATVDALRAEGHDVLGVHTDVRLAPSVEELARRTREAYGDVHVLCNNAGVTVGSGPAWQATIADWQWCLEVNLWGVIHGLRAFLPGMLAHGQEGHVVNTASHLALSSEMLGVYGVTKHAIVGLAEDLHRDLTRSGARIGTSVLCPGPVMTRIMSSHRNRPAELQNPPQDSRPVPVSAVATFARAMLEGPTADEVAIATIAAIRTNQFWVIPTSDDASIRRRFEGMLSRTNPSE